MRQLLVYPSNGYAIKPPASSRIHPANVGEHLAIRPRPAATPPAVRDGRLAPAAARAVLSVRFGLESNTQA